MYSREEIKKLHLSFWELFGKRCEIHPQLKGRRRKWLLHRTKVKGVALRFEVDRQNARVILELNNKSETLRLKAYEFLERYKTILETDFDTELTWEFFHEREDSGKEVCRIYKQLDEVDFHRQNQWADIYNFFIENMLLLEQNFLEVRELLQEELKH